MRYTVFHETEYHYESTVTLSQQILHMVPRNTPFQVCEQYALNISPMPVEHTQNQDYFGNYTNYFAIYNPHNELLVTSEFRVNLQNRPTFIDLQQSMAWDQLKLRLSTKLYQEDDAVNYLYSSPHVVCSEALLQYARPCFAQGKPLIEAVLALTQRIYQEFEFDAEATEVSTPLEEALSGKRGVCQDFAHLMIGCLRSLGLSARYVSGYILTNPPAGKERLIGADASHAWVSVYCPVFGWVDFDPTNNCLVGNEHITVGWGRDFSDVSPMRGIALGGGAQALNVSVTVMPEILVNAY